MYKYFLFLILILLFACKKEEKPNIENDVDPDIHHFELVTSPGSYWVYDVYSIDSLGNEAILPHQDTMKLIGDTLINGNKYALFKGKTFGWNASYALRDSSGYLVFGNGNIMMSYTNFTDTLQIFEDQTNKDILFIIMDEAEHSISVPAGNFDVVRSMLTYFKTDGTDFTACNKTHTFNTYYASGIGEILSQNSFYHIVTSTCAYRERRLVSFHIAD